MVRLDVVVEEVVEVVDAGGERGGGCAWHCAVDD